MQREACFQGVRTALRSASLGGKSDFGATFPWGSLSMGELSLYNTGMVRQTWVWEFDITILHRKGNVRSKTFSCFVPCAPIPEDSIPGVPTYPYPPTACLKVHFNYDASYDTPKGYEYSTGGRFLQVKNLPCSQAPFQYF